MLSGVARADVPYLPFEYFQFASVQSVFQEQVDDGIEKQIQFSFGHARITKIS